MNNPMIFGGTCWNMFHERKLYLRAKPTIRLEIDYSSGYSKMETHVEVHGRRGLISWRRLDHGNGVGINLIVGLIWSREDKRSSLSESTMRTGNVLRTAWSSLTCFPLVFLRSMRSIIFAIAAGALEADIAPSQRVLDLECQTCQM